MAVLIVWMICLSSLIATIYVMYMINKIVVAFATLKYPPPSREDLELIEDDTVDTTRIISGK